MRKIAMLIAIAMVVAALMPAAFAQSSENTMAQGGPPPILHIGREEVKPGKQFAHEKIETAWTQALIHAKYQQAFLAAESVTGPSEVLWFYGFPSIAAYEADYKNVFSNPTLSSVTMQYGSSEADVIASTGDMIARYRDDLSYNPSVNVGEMRYFAIRTTRVRIGHTQDFEELLKAVNEARKAVGNSTHMATYQIISGAAAGTFLTIVPRKSLAEMDEKQPQIASDAQQRITELAEKSVQVASDAIYALNPRMSKPTEEIAKADPAFWRPKVTMAKAAEPSQPAAKPAAAPAKNKP